MEVSNVLCMLRFVSNLLLLLVNSHEKFVPVLQYFISNILITFEYVTVLLIVVLILHKHDNARHTRTENLVF